MKKFIFLPTLLLFFLSCSNDDSHEDIIDDGTVGVERFLMQLSPQFSNPHRANTGATNSITYQGYVMPNYLGGKVEVFVTITSDSDITISYADEEKSLGEEFKVDELFKELKNDEGVGTGAYDNFFDLGLSSEAVGEKNLVLNFRNSLGSTFRVSNTVILE